MGPSWANYLLWAPYARDLRTKCPICSCCSQDIILYLQGGWNSLCQNLLVAFWLCQHIEIEEGRIESPQSHTFNPYGTYPNLKFVPNDIDKRLTDSFNITLRALTPLFLDIRVVCKISKCFFFSRYSNNHYCTVLYYCMPKQKSSVRIKVVKGWVIMRS